MVGTSEVLHVKHSRAVPKTLCSYFIGTPAEQCCRRFACWVSPCNGRMNRGGAREWPRIPPPLRRPPVGCRPRSFLLIAAHSLHTCLDLFLTDSERLPWRCLGSRSEKRN